MGKRLLLETSITLEVSELSLVYLSSGALLSRVIKVILFSLVAALIVYDFVFWPPSYFWLSLIADTLGRKICFYSALLSVVLFTLLQIPSSSNYNLFALFTVRKAFWSSQSKINLLCHCDATGFEKHGIATYI